VWRNPVLVSARTQTACITVYWYAISEVRADIYERAFWRRPSAIRLRCTNCLLLTHRPAGQDSGACGERKQTVRTVRNVRYHCLLIARVRDWQPMLEKCYFVLRCDAKKCIFLVTIVATEMSADRGTSGKAVTPYRIGPSLNHFPDIAGGTHTK
jgi:hypothetical protein